MKRILVSLLALPLFSACGSPPIVQDGIEVRILPAHRHNRYCGHYLSEGNWYYVKNHKHAVNCGHVLEAGVWQKTR